ncbi:hypothetical protein Tco_1499062 [Tanacetum coccineum]
MNSLYIKSKFLSKDKVLYGAQEMVMESSMVGMDHLYRQNELGELWDCQLCNLTAGKGSGGEEKDNMANENVPAPAPTRSDDQILPFAAWISVDIMQNRNFFRAFTAPASVPAIYIQQFWNTLTYEVKTGAYSFQLDETQFVLDVNLLREALEITPIDQAHQFVSPLSGDVIMDFVNELGTNVDYAELMWEEFVQAIQAFLTDKANLGSPTKKGRKYKPHDIPYCSGDVCRGQQPPRKGASCRGLYGANEGAVVGIIATAWVVWLCLYCPEKGVYSAFYSRKAVFVSVVKNSPNRGMFLLFDNKYGAFVSAILASVEGVFGIRKIAKRGVLVEQINHKGVFGLAE